MTRLAAQAKLQYYPTPPLVVDLVRSRIAIDLPRPATISILDPCAGDGAALIQLAETLGEVYPGLAVYSMAVELSATRGARLRERGVHDVLGGEVDALQDVSYPQGQVDLLFLNPPYDEAKGGRRLETKFLHLFLAEQPVLTPGGLLVLIVSGRHFGPLHGLLGRWLDNLYVCRFPDAEYEAFEQIVIFGNMRASEREVADTAWAEIREWKRLVQLGALYPLDDEALGDAAWAVPTRTTLTPRMRLRAQAPEELLTLVREHSILDEPLVHAEHWGAPPPLVETLLDLDPSLLGVLISGGLFDNTVLTVGGHRQIIKGHCPKEKVHTKSVIVDDEGTVEDTYVERFRPQVYALDLETAVFTCYELPPPEPPKKFSVTGKPDTADDGTTPLPLPPDEEDDEDPFAISA